MGFVTGGGWITSPAGALAGRPELSGKASLGFTSRYAKGAKVPSGQTQFEFSLGGFQFNSTSYEWLVVSGSRAQYKGQGVVNGGGDYGFLLTANDGQVSGGGGVDRFRIKVWDRATGSVVYDNQPGAGDDAAASTALAAARSWCTRSGRGPASGSGATSTEAAAPERGGAGPQDAEESSQMLAQSRLPAAVQGGRGAAVRCGSNGARKKA